MVDDRITDGERIAQLLASELSGLAVDSLADVTVTDANPDASPTESGTLAYALAFAGERTGEVYMYPDRVRVELSIPGSGRDAPDADRASESGDTDQPDECAGDVALTVDSGAAVKQTVDAVREAFRDVADG
jgi:hypothetical protein